MGASGSTQTQDNVLLLGLDGAGKSSIIARLLGDEGRTVLPTLGFSMHAFMVGDLKMQVKLWDLGGRSSVRSYWPAYYGRANAIAYVIDTTDRHRLAENSAVLQHLLDDDELIGLPLLVFANKQDAADAIPAAEIEELLHLGSIRDRVWHCTSCSALRGTGIVDGLTWLADTHSQIHGLARARARRRARSAVKRGVARASLLSKVPRAPPHDDERTTQTAPISARSQSAASQGTQNRRRLRASASAPAASAQAAGVGAYEDDVDE